jgi:hypothetical protein
LSTRRVAEGDRRSKNNTLIDIGHLTLLRKSLLTRPRVSKDCCMCAWSRRQHPHPQHKLGGEEGRVLSCRKCYKDATTCSGIFLNLCTALSHSHSPSLCSLFPFYTTSKKTDLQDFFLIIILEYRSVLKSPFVFLQSVLPQQPAALTTFYSSSDL